MLYFNRILQHPPETLCMMAARCTTMNLHKPPLQFTLKQVALTFSSSIYTICNIYFGCHNSEYK